MFVVCVCAVCGVCVWSVCKTTLARSRSFVPSKFYHNISAKSLKHTCLCADCELMVHGFLLSTYNSLPGGGVTKITDIIFKVQHATINSLLALIELEYRLEIDMVIPYYY